ncbi:uncharacterized protein LOC115403361 [Salarias fasciatus]|uniref:uncharacterized protein LOC115403361 n=1 Tax=Salarias fasciatus TaxID=181472 RepID=UPI001176ED4C|nr:uncharacterized protein LOC115403361 [Salarias fasciatus]
MALRRWRHPAFLVTGVPMGPVLSRKVITTDASMSGWGGICEDRYVRGVWSEDLQRAHINYLELLAVFLTLRRFLPLLRGHHVLVRTDNTTTVAYINRHGGLRSRQLHMLARRLILWSSVRLRSLRATHVPGALNRGADLLSRGAPLYGEWMLHPALVEQVWARFGRAAVDLCAARRGRARARLAVGPPVCFSPVGFDSPDSGQSQGASPHAGSDSSAVAGHALASGGLSAPVGAAMAASPPQGHAVTGRGSSFSPTSGAPGSLGLAPEWCNLNTAGLPQNVIDTIQSARAASTRSLYDCKWRVFEEWCQKKGHISFQCTVGVILPFLQDLIDKRKAFSTIKVYLAAIAACHVGFGGKTVSQHPLVCRFMKGARRLLPVCRPLAPPWDLAVVLNGLSRAPFEPLEEVSLKHLSLKTALLLALASAKRVSDIHALSVHSSCTQFAPGNARVSLKPHLAFVPKVVGSCSPIVLTAFSPPPFSSPEERRLHMLCPVRALRIYMDRTMGFREGDQLFVSWARPCRGRPITKQRLSHWIVGAIALAYTCQGLQAPVGLRAHSTRGLAASWALCKGVSIQEICAAASWSSPLTFVRFYKLDIPALSLAHAVLTAGLS